MSTLYRNPMHKGEYRNHPCICNSGKKMKKCHGAERGVTAEGLKEIHELGEAHNKRVMEFNDEILKKAQEMAEKGTVK